MKKNAFALPIFAGAFLLFTGCGDDVTKTTVNETTGISQLAKGEAFPECSKDNAGEMLYAADSSAVYYCADGAWETLNGKDGADGADGKDGTDGSDGKDGTNGADGQNGASGESCEAVALSDGSGYKILCGEDSIGVVLNGTNGSDGADGADGSDGQNGESCTVTDDGNGVVTVICGEDSVKLAKALCANEPYDPATKFCFSHVARNDTIAFLCNGNTYDPYANFCVKAYTDRDSLVVRCGDEIFDLDSQYCKETSGGDVVANKSFVTTKYLNQTMLANGDYGLLFDSRDGQVYRTVVIGEQTWMAQNLNYALNTSKKGSQVTQSTTNVSEYIDAFGRVYLQSDTSVVCPAGWVVPSISDMYEFFTAVNSNMADVTDWGQSSGEIIY